LLLLPFLHGLSNGLKGLYDCRNIIAIRNPQIDTGTGSMQTRFGAPCTRLRRLSLRFDPQSRLFFSQHYTWLEHCACDAAFDDVWSDDGFQVQKSGASYSAIGNRAILLSMRQKRLKREGDAQRLF
jgi:hypothetical protein